MTSVLFLVRFNNFALTMGVTHSYSKSPVLMHSWWVHTQGQNSRKSKG